MSDFNLLADVVNGNADTRSEYILSKISNKISISEIATLSSLYEKQVGISYLYFLTSIMKEVSLYNSKNKNLTFTDSEQAEISDNLTTSFFSEKLGIDISDFDSIKMIADCWKDENEDLFKKFMKMNIHTFIKNIIKV